MAASVATELQARPAGETQQISYEMQEWKKRQRYAEGQRGSRRNTYSAPLRGSCSGHCRESGQKLLSSNRRVARGRSE
jgi:hypothetical protein